VAFLATSVALDLRQILLGFLVLFGFTLFSVFNVDAIFFKFKNAVLNAIFL